MRLPRSHTRLYCFSPPVMVATFVIEIALALRALLAYERGTLKTLIVATLACLATFQLAEYFVCGGLGASGLLWSRIGYVAITLLPPLGITIIGEFSGRPPRALLAVAWGLAGALVAFFAFAPAAVNVSLCAGNYVVFKLNGLNAMVYAAYYYGAILACIMLATGRIEKAANAHEQAAVRWFLIGLLALLVPTSIANALDLKTVAGIPSIMCGFAVLYALVLTFKVLPLAARAKTTS